MEWVAFLVAAGAAAGVWWARRVRHARQRHLMLLCRDADLEFAPLDPFPDTAWLPFPMFGHARHGTENVIWDPGSGTDVRAFDFWFQDPSDERPTGARHAVTCAVVPLGFTCPSLRVIPRDTLDDAATAVGRREVRLELDGFDRRFRVDADDARSAMAFLDQRMMEVLLRIPFDVTVDVNEDVLLLWGPRLRPAQMLLLLRAAIEIRRHIPRVVASLFPQRPTRGPFEQRWLQGRWSPESTGADIVGELGV